MPEPPTRAADDQWQHTTMAEKFYFFLTIPLESERPGYYNFPVFSVGPKPPHRE
jgi:hypothetical protein